jgi:hypothetical protein
MTQLIDPRYEFLGSDDFVIKRTQEITDDFLTQNAEKRSASRAPMGEFHQFASIPTGIVEKWMREGFDIWTEPAKAIVARLKQEDLSAFLTSERKI